MYPVLSISMQIEIARSGLLQSLQFVQVVSVSLSTSVELRPPFAVSIIVRLPVIGWSNLAHGTSAAESAGAPTRVDRAATVHHVRRSWLILRGSGV